MPEHLSNSQFSLFCKCPEAWRRRYEEGEKIPPGVAMLIGTGVHFGIETNFIQKIETHEDLTPRQIREAAVAGLEERIERDGLELTEEEKSIGQTRIVGEAVDKTSELAALHAIEVAPQYQPAFVEERVELYLPQVEKTLVGVLDLGTEDRKVIDFKTTGKQPSQKETDRSTQLTIYSILYRHLTGQQAEECRLEILTKTKVAKRKMFSTTRGQADFDALANRIHEITRSIEAGIFPPCEPTAWNCDPKWCGYYSTCKFVNNGTRRQND